MNQGLFLNPTTTPPRCRPCGLNPFESGSVFKHASALVNPDPCSLNPFESGSVFKQRGAGFSFLIKCLQSSFPIFFLSPKLSHFFTPAVLFIFCRRAYATPLVGGVNAPCPARRSFRCCRCGVYRLVCRYDWIGLPLCPAK